MLDYFVTCFPGLAIVALIVFVFVFTFVCYYFDLD